MHFDNHPDWVRYPPPSIAAPGSTCALRTARCQGVVTIGPCSDDLHTPGTPIRQSPAMREGRLARLPLAQHPTSRCGARLSRAPSTTTEGRGSAPGATWPMKTGQLFSTNSSQPADVPALWITIDKDVLGPGRSHSRTGTRARCRSIISSPRSSSWPSSFRIVGVDVCGDYSPPRFGDPFRATLAYFDHPALEAPSPDKLAINAEVNASLLACFEQVLS